MDNLLQFLNNSSTFQYYFTLIWLIVFPLIILVFLFNLFILVNKIFPFNSKNCPVDIPKKPEKSFSLSSIKVDSFQFNSPYLKLNFYSDFMTIESFGKYIILGYTDDITIKEFLFFRFFYFKKDDHEYRVSLFSKQAIEYLKMKIGKL